MSINELPPPIEPDDAHPTPINVFIVKVAARCNLNCSYCYMYNMADQQWRGEPLFMEEQTMRDTANAVATHVFNNQVPRTRVVFHGGEPPLAEKARPGYFAKAVDMFHEAMEKVGAKTELRFGLQTNGAFPLDWLEKTFKQFKELGIRVGVSLDGDQIANDRYRLDHAGRSSFFKALAAVSLYPENQSSTLALIDLKNPPDKTYDFFGLAIGPDRSVDFNLPHGSWSSPPPGFNPDRPNDPMGYGLWLAKIYDTHFRFGGPKVPLFQEIQSLLLGEPGTLEFIGLAVPRVLTITTKGEVEDVDTLRAIKDGRTKLGITVRDKDAFNKAVRSPEVSARQMGVLGLSQVCKDCPILEICGGGYFPHRYKEGSNQGEAFPELAEFMNPSVYCADIKQLVSYMFILMSRHPKIRQRLFNGGRGRQVRQLLNTQYVHLPRGIRTFDPRIPRI